MKSVKYYVCNCLECKSPVLVKVDYMEFNEKCCLEFSNVKIMKTFNDELEAKNYIKLMKKDEEDEE
jgi:hypothetical protein